MGETSEGLEEARGERTRLRAGPSEPAPGRKDWTCPLQAGCGQMGQRGERRQSVLRTAFTAAVQPTLFPSPFGWWVGLIFRTWLKCHISKRSSPLFSLVTALFSIGASSVFLPAKELNICSSSSASGRYPPRRQGPCASLSFTIALTEKHST